MRKILTALCAASLSTSIFAVPGWSTDHISMGTVIDGSSSTLQKLKQRPVESIFTYAGINGAGDRGTFIATDTKIQTMMQQARELEATTGKKVQPVVVFYSVDGSDGIWAMQQDLDIDPQATTDNLYLHYANLIRMAQLLQSYKDEAHPHPATLLLNPDYLGELHKQCEQWYCPIPFDQPVKVHEGLTKAIHYLTERGYITAPVSIPNELQRTNTTIADYNMSVNWLIRTFAPDVAFGWQDNIWAGDSSGHGWIHQATQQSALIDSHAQNEVAFLTQMKVFTVPYQPDFIAFDKWERDVFDAKLDGAGLKNGYLYNAKDWDVYTQFVSKVSAQLNNVPVMLWQIPGGHLQITGDTDQRHDHASTAPDYFIGDTQLNAQLSNVDAYIKSGTINPTVYGVQSSNAFDYLKCPTETPDCWQKNRLSALAQQNIFAILWGGGSTTGIVGLNDGLEDGGWLFRKLGSV